MIHAEHLRKRRANKPDEINLTPMIDVVFQLLVYFVFTFEAVDIFTHLSVFRPSVNPSGCHAVEVVNIAIFPEGKFVINGKDVTHSQMEGMLLTLADLNPSQLIYITCTSKSLHQHLIELLDLCAKANLANLSVTSQ